MNPLRPKRFRHQPRALGALLAATACASACSADYTLGTLPPDDVQVDLVAAAGGSALPADEQTAGAPETASAWTSFSVNNGGVPSGGNLGDLDGDGFTDWGYISYPAIEIYYGGSRPMDGQVGDASLQYAGRPGHPTSLQAAGDLDGDGYGDLLILLGQNDPQRQPIEARVLYGGPRLSGSLAMTEETRALIHPDTALAAETLMTPTQGRALGDIDGDGFDDFLLAWHQDPDSSPDGRSATLYVFYGGPTRLVDGSSWETADARLSYVSDVPIQGRVAMAVAVQAAGDLDGDGRAEVLLATQASQGGSVSQLRVWRGDSQRLDSEVELSDVAEAQPGVLVNYLDLQGAVDFDGDGLRDLRLSPDGSDMTYLYYGRPGLLDTQLRLSDADASFRYYEHRAVALDWNGDGFQDLIVQDVDVLGAAVLLSPKGRFDGHTVLSTDNPALLPLPALAPNEPKRNAQQQWLAGDIDGDGRDELLVESWHRESQGPDQWTSRAPQLHLGFSSIAAPSTPL